MIQLLLTTNNIQQIRLNLFSISDTNDIKITATLLYTQHNPTSRSISKSTDTLPYILGQFRGGFLNLEVVPLNVIQPCQQFVTSHILSEEIRLQNFTSK